MKRLMIDTAVIRNTKNQPIHHSALKIRFSHLDDFNAASPNSMFSLSTEVTLTLKLYHIECANK